MPRNSIDNSLERYAAVEEIAKVYLKKDRLIKIRSNSFNKSSQKTIRKINKIEKAWKVLCDPYRTIIKNTFFEKKELYWWTNYYSKTTYYRLRNKAINAFLLAYNLQ